VILNANIPLRAPSPTRQLSWRVGVFLGIFLLGFAGGFFIMKKLFIGIRTPYLATSSGISLRITPENELWLATHASGYTLSETCPIDLPLLLSWSSPSAILLGDSGQEELVITGNAPKELTNLGVVFSCTITPQKKGYSLGNPAQDLQFIPLFSLASGHAWREHDFFSFILHPWGMSLAIPTASPQTSVLWPKETLTQALPFAQERFEIRSHQFQGIDTLLSTHKGLAMFSWEKEGDNAFGIVVTEDLNDDELLSIVYDLADIPQVSQRMTREDGTSYTTYASQNVTLSEIHDGIREAQLADTTPVGFLSYQNHVIGISTAPTTWTFRAPRWSIRRLAKNSAIQHASRTLTSIGSEFFFSEKNINILTY
jgi:hypothetical protein